MAVRFIHDNRMLAERAFYCCLIVYLAENVPAPMFGNSRLSLNRQ